MTAGGTRDRRRYFDKAALHPHPRGKTKKHTVESKLRNRAQSLRLTKVASRNTNSKKRHQSEANRRNVASYYDLGFGMRDMAGAARSRMQPGFAAARIMRLGSLAQVVSPEELLSGLPALQREALSESSPPARPAGVFLFVGEQRSLMQTCSKCRRQLESAALGARWLILTLTRAGLLRRGHHIVISRHCLRAVGARVRSTNQRTYCIYFRQRTVIHTIV